MAWKSEWKSTIGYGTAMTKSFGHTDHNIKTYLDVDNV